MSKADRHKLALLRELNPDIAAAEKFRLLRGLHPEFDRQLELQWKIDLFEELGCYGVSVRNTGSVPTLDVEQSASGGGLTHAGVARVDSNVGAEAVATEIAEPKTKPGPKTDIETARRVAGIVERVRDGEPWKSKLDDICDALDEEKIPCPKTWKKKDINSWGDATLPVHRELAKKAIIHHLKNARLP